MITRIGIPRLHSNNGQPPTAPLGGGFTPTRDQELPYGARRAARLFGALAKDQDGAFI